jgi:hypothetical protein
MIFLLTGICVFLYLCSASNNTLMIVVFTLDSTHTLHDTDFIVLQFWADERTKAQIGEWFEYGESWADKRLRVIYKVLNVHSDKGAIEKAWLMGIFTFENRAKDAAWRKRDFSHLHNPAHAMRAH